MSLLEESRERHFHHNFFSAFSLTNVTAKLKFHNFPLASWLSCAPISRTHWAKNCLFVKWSNVGWTSARSKRMKSPPPNSEGLQGTAAGSELLGDLKTAHKMPAGHVGEKARLSGREISSHVLGEKRLKCGELYEGHSALCRKSFQHVNRL